MALDNAEFISELSITDPPGTDPLNQGDDHIRTTKRATQQSFPNVDAPVPQTAAQMAQMAIKNEVNTYTQQNIFQNGTALLPGIAFAGRTSTGFYASAGDRINIATSGVTRAFLDVSQFRSEVVMTLIDGSAFAPSYSFKDQLDMGMFRDGAGLNFATFGVLRLNMENGQMRSNNSGSAAAPAWSFVNDNDMGMFRQFNTSLGFAVGGAQAFHILAGQVRTTQNGTAAAPAYSFNSGSGDMGMYRLAADQLAFVVQQVTRFIIKGNTFTMANLPTGPGGLLVTGDLYAKQSQTFAGTELVMGVQP